MLIREAEDLLDRKLFGLRCRYIGWMSKSMAAVNWTVFSTGHSIDGLWQPKIAFRFQRHLTKLTCHLQSHSLLSKKTVHRQQGGQNPDTGRD